jgi:hypothetical protein
VELLKKITFTYSEVEDRIRMSAELKNGEPVLFWLTLRLCRRLVRALIDHIERSVPRSSLVDTGLLLSCRQRDAEWQHESSEPVSFSAGSLKVLPEKIELSYSQHHAGLLFPLGDGQEAQLQMTLQELRQWLAILHRQFKKAGWPMEVWPAWFVKPVHGRN